ncbi:hypothetical protein EVAR_27589_1 [Eumeta japonica]|uniref:Uncharacterized protein n=1 Tax=Eumeta variegata TaxID=151549 RepID=A0A4C1WCJ6_EUMVA|nr:hypothetical protein EVAR_27589_1 [Eumeta japonica]
MVNVWKELLPVTIITSNLGPFFRLNLLTESLEPLVDDDEIKFDLKPSVEAMFRLTLRPNNDKISTCSLASNTYRIIFPPALLNSKLSHTINLSIDEEVSMNGIFTHCKDENCITINFLEENFDKKLCKTTFTVEIEVCSEKKGSNHSIITFHHCEYTNCEIEVDYCFTSCPLTLHANPLIDPNDNPYPYFPTEENDEFFNYMTATLTFLEKWMFEEGFKKELYPTFPCTFYATASVLKDQNKGSKKKRNAVSYINFISRLAGPLFEQSKGKSVEKGSSGTDTKKSSFVVEYKANFVNEVKTILIFYGSSETRIFDSYAVFSLIGHISSAPPIAIHKLSSPIYIYKNASIPVTSPFCTSADFRVFVTDTEPEIPVAFENTEKPKFYLRRLTLKVNVLHVLGKSTDQTKVKLFVRVLCMSTQTGNSWIWFRSDIGEFSVQVTTQPRLNLPIRSLSGRFNKWPVEPCDCGEECECYRTTVLKLPHRNDLTLTALRSALSEFASEVMLEVYDRLIESPKGKVIIQMLLEENGVNMSELKHMFSDEVIYHLKSKSLFPRLETVALYQHSTDELDLPITLPNVDKKEMKDEQTHTITLVSEDDLDVRTYTVKFNTSETDSSTTRTSPL